MELLDLGFRAILLYSFLFVFVNIIEIAVSWIYMKYPRLSQVFGGFLLGLVLIFQVVIKTKYEILSTVPGGGLGLVFIASAFYAYRGGLLTMLMAFFATIGLAQQNTIYVVISYFGVFFLGNYYAKIIKDKNRVKKYLYLTGMIFLGYTFSELVLKVTKSENPLNPLSISEHMMMITLITILAIFLGIQLHVNRERISVWRKLKNSNAELTAQNQEISALYNQLSATEDVLNLKYDEIIAYQKKLETSEKLYRTAIEAGRGGFAQYNFADHSFEVSTQLIQIMDYSVEDKEEIERNFIRFIHPQQQEEFQRLLDDTAYNQRADFDYEVRLRTKGGDYKWFIYRAIMEHDYQKPAMLVGTYINIDDRKEKEEIAFNIAYLDAKSKLFNANAFKESITVRMVVNSQFAVLFFGIMRYKLLKNIKYEISRDIIKSIADHLKKLIKNIDSIFYLGNGRFAICYEQDEEKKIEDDYKKIQEIVRKIIQDDFLHINMDFRFEVLGFFLKIPEDKDVQEYKLFYKTGTTYLDYLEGLEKTELMRYNDMLFKKLMRSNRIESLLNVKKFTNEMYMVYQPIYHVLSQELICFEALIRWKNEELGMINPDEFIVIAEQSDAIRYIGEFVLQESCEFINEFSRKNNKKIHVSVNVSVFELLQKEFVERVCKTIQCFNLEYEQINLEVTESQISEFMNVVVDSILQLKELGFQIHLDDYGTGYSSISRINELKADVIKIDKMFVLTLEENTENYYIVQNIIELAHKLGKKVIAEGVEAIECLEILKKLNCDYVQGYYFSKPLEANQIFEAF